jgi:hypothetical protein
MLVSIHFIFMLNCHTSQWLNGQRKNFNTPVTTTQAVIGVPRASCYAYLVGLLREPLDNWSPVEAVACANWKLRALTGAAEEFSRASLEKL